MAEGCVKQPVAETGTPSNVASKAWSDWASLALTEARAALHNRQALLAQQ